MTKKKNEGLSDEARKKLIQIGIPESEHTVAGLRRLFPPEFKINEILLEPESLAEVLTHLVKHKIIRLPKRSGQ